MKNIIEIKNLTKTFIDGKNVVTALDNISIEIKKGEIYGLLGQNGAGKTTLISILTGLVSRDRGDISVFGMDFDKNLTKIKQRINIVSGFTMISMFLTVKEYLKYFALLYSVKDAGKKISDAIRILELDTKKDAIVNDLSSGYKQRLLLAKALLNDPEIIFMDEPTVGLDVGIAIKIRELIEQLKAKGTTIIFTSHNLNEVEQLCDRVTLISKGKILQSGTINEIKKRVRDNKILEVVCKYPKKFMQEISRLKEVEEAHIIGDKIIIKAKTIEDVDLIMKKSINSDFIIMSIRKIEPTLEEAFINIMEEDN